MMRILLYDYFRFISIWLIVYIHTESINANNSFAIISMNTISRMAVPFFFTLTGFMIYRKLDKEKKHISNNILNLQKNLQKTLYTYIIWTIIIIIFNNIIRIVRGIIKKEEVKIFLIDINDILFNGYGVLWYLIATFWGIILFVILYKYFKIENIVKLGFVLFIIGNLGKNQMFNILNFGTRNFIFFAFPYISLGVYLALKNEKKDMRKYNKKILMIVFLINIIISSICFYIMKNMYYQNVVLDIMPLFYLNIIILFELITQYKELFKKDNLITKMGRKSQNIYLMHMFYISILSRLNIKYVLKNNLMAICIVTTVILIISFYSYELMSITFNKWRKKDE